MTPALTLAAAISAATTGPWLRAHIFAHSVAYGRPKRTQCPRCRDPITMRPWRSVLPVTGRCPTCRQRIGPAPGVVEACAAAVVGLLAWHNTDTILFAATVWIAGHGTVMSFVDTTVHRLPDRLTISAFAGAATLLAAAAIAAGSYSRMLTAVLGSLALAGFYTIMVLAKPQSLGLGDAKLALVLGLVLGWYGPGAVVTGLIAAIGISLATGLGLLVLHRIRSDQPFAHGPAMLLGALLAYTLAQ